jgi:hypothetical protein
MTTSAFLMVHICVKNGDVGFEMVLLAFREGLMVVRMQKETGG